MNILYIASPESIHDIKLIRFFSENAGNNIYLVTEKDSFFKLTEKEIEGFRKIRINIVPPIGNFSIKNFASTLKDILHIKKLIKKHEIEIVHVLFTTPGGLWAKFISKPFILTTRGSDILVVIPNLLKTKGIKSFHDVILFRFFKNIYKRAAGITSTSIPQVEKARQLFGVYSNLIRTGVDVPAIESINSKEHLPEILKGKSIIFSPRFFKPVYNIELQIEAIKQLESEIIDKFHFVFIKGKFNNEYTKSLSKRLSEIKNLKYIVLDFLTQEEIWSTYKMASLTIMTPNSDGTPNSALEAMAARCPLILGSFNYDPDLFSDTCMRLSKDEPKELARQISSSILSYPEELLEKGFNTVLNKGNLKKEMKKIEDLYTQVLWKRS